MQSIQYRLLHLWQILAFFDHNMEDSSVKKLWKTIPILDKNLKPKDIKFSAIHAQFFLYMLETK